ncbi:hypothetical protein pb186bvf_000922 [Paramecium bursaria]
MNNNYKIINNKIRIQEGLAPLTPDQEKKYNEFAQFTQEKVKGMVQDLRYQNKYIEKSHLVRLLIAREWNVKKSQEMWIRWIEWRQQYKADNIDPIEIKQELDLNKSFWIGYDKQRNPTLLIKPKRHFPGQVPEEMFIRAFIYRIEQGIEMADKVGTGKITVIWDREGVTSKNFDYSMFGVMKKIVTLLQDNYAERLYVAITLYPNFFAKSMMALIKPFLSEKSKSKIKLCDNIGQLKEYIVEDQLKYFENPDLVVDPEEEKRQNEIAQRLEQEKLEIQ